MSTDVIPAVDTTKSGVGDGYDPLSSIMVETAQELYATLAQQKDADKVAAPDPTQRLTVACEIEAGTNITSFGNESGIMEDVSNHIKSIDFTDWGEASI